MHDGLRRLDNLQSGWGLFVPIAVFGIGDLFCTLDHTAPWAKVFFAASMLVFCGSVLLRGAWRLRLVVRSVVAAAALAVAGFMFALGPMLVPNASGMAIWIVSSVVGVGLWSWILGLLPQWRPGRPGLS